MKLADLEHDPYWLPDRLSPDLRTLTCVRVTRQALVESPFLDDRLLVSPREECRIDLAGADIGATVTRLRATAPPPGVIFHTSFCSSTILARTLHRDGDCLALKEPRILFDVAGLLRAPDARVNPQTKQAMVALAFALLRRRLREGEAVIVKPTNLANNLLPFAVAEGCQVLLMYSELRPFLISLLMRGEPGHLFGRSIFRSLLEGGTRLSTMAIPEALMLTDGQAAALAWRQQMELFATAIATAPPDRIRTLCSESFHRQTTSCIDAAYRHFGIASEPNAAPANDVLAANVKRPGEAFDSTENRERRGAFEAFAAETLDDLLKWAAPLRIERDFSLPLGNALLG